MEMTKHDIKNYLTKIYQIPVVDVRTEVRLGEFYQDIVKKYVKKKDDYRVAIVTLVNSVLSHKFLVVWDCLIYRIDLLILFLRRLLMTNLISFQPSDVAFDFPVIFDKDKQADDLTKAKKQLRDQADEHKKFLERNRDSRSSPPWFSIWNRLLY